MQIFKLKSKTISALLIFGCLLAFSCSSAEQKANGLYETAVFEEKQFNSEHAVKLYEQIINKYPDTETAGKAQKALVRLKEEENKKINRGG